MFPTGTHAHVRTVHIHRLTQMTHSTLTQTQIARMASSCSSFQLIRMKVPLWEIHIHIYNVDPSRLPSNWPRYARTPQLLTLVCYASTRPTVPLQLQTPLNHRHTHMHGHAQVHHGSSKGILLSYLQYLSCVLLNNIEEEFLFQG